MHLLGSILTSCWPRNITSHTSHHLPHFAKLALLRQLASHQPWTSAYLVTTRMEDPALTGHPEPGHPILASPGESQGAQHKDALSKEGQAASPPTGTPSAPVTPTVASRAGQPAQGEGSAAAATAGLHIDQAGWWNANRGRVYVVLAVAKLGMAALLLLAPTLVRCRVVLPWGSPGPLPQQALCRDGWSKRRLPLPPGD